MATICKYCNEPENKQDSPGLVCETCICFVHLGCLRRQSTPGDFAGDVFYDFICQDCSDDNLEVFKRSRFPWANVIYLTLYHLTTDSYGISNYGYFHYKTHICHFIDREWNVLLGNQFKQKKNWIGTIAGALSVYNNMLFRSGSAVLGETGWWRLMHGFTPAVAAHILQEMARDKPKSRLKTQLTEETNLFIEKVTELGYKDLLGGDNELFIPRKEPVPQKKRKVDSDELSRISNTSYFEYFGSDGRNETLEDNMQDDPLSNLTSRDGSFSDVESVFRGFDYTPSNPVLPDDSSSTYSFQQSTLNYDSDSGSGSPYTKTEVMSDDSNEKAIMSSVPVPECVVKQDKTAEKEKPTVPLVENTLFSSQLNSLTMPWMTEDHFEVEKDLVKLSEYEEVQLLKRVEDLVQKIKDPDKRAELRRFRAKLSVRRLKRRKHLPIFDFDKTVRTLGGYNSEDPRSIVNIERVLDRFQTSYLMDNLCGTVAPSTQGPLLLSRMEPVSSQSPYSGAVLKPYIRRDSDTTPHWLKLTDELLRKVNRNVPNYRPPPHATLDYSYVRPQHIAAVNGLCAHFFWPGIDLTEALQYPEFSCVVSYRRLVVGCAFLVPDVSQNEAYISFVLTRPGWRNAGIATFMLYHLLQTCSGKDVTLHVSPTNPAIFLYQKFGFKVEELVQDFYEKYYDVEYKGCRHALFLRLTR